MTPSREPLPGELVFRSADQIVDSPDEEVAPESDFLDEVAAEPCRRCRKPYPVIAENCPYCSAGNPAAAVSRTGPLEPAESELRPLNVVISAFGVMLLLSVLFMVALASNPALQGRGVEPLRQQLTAITIVEGIDTIIVAFAAMLLLGLSSPKDPARPLTAWLVAGPALAATLAVNLAYHALIESLGIPVHDLPMTTADTGLALWGLATICVQPALIEEWFFRGIAWKSFRRYLGVHGTVWVIAVMFGMAHIGAFLSVPVLILIGGLLGYARLYSGGLLLPIVLHFLHNLLISLWGAGS